MREQFIYPGVCISNLISLLVRIGKFRSVRPFMVFCSEAISYSPQILDTKRISMGAQFHDDLPRFLHGLPYLSRPHLMLGVFIYTVDTP